MRTKLTILTMFLSLALPTRGQTAAFSLGTSDLFQTTGGTIKIWMPDGSSYETGIGIIGNHLEVGANATRDINDYLVSAGDQVLTFALPSDFNPSGYGYEARGISVRLADHYRSSNPVFVPNAFVRTLGRILPHCLIFAGGSAVGATVPYFQSASFATPLGYIACQGKLSEKWTLSSHESFSKTQSAIQSLEFRPAQGITFAGSLGIGGNRPYASALAKYEGLNRRLLLKGSYTTSSADFRRIIVSTPLLAENTKLNVQAIYLPWRDVSLMASQNHLTSPELAGPGVSATVDNVGAYIRHSIFDGHVSDYNGSSRGVNVSGQDYGIGATLKCLTVREDYLRSKTEGAQFATAVTSVSERVKMVQLTENYIRSTTAEGVTNSLDAGVMVKTNPLTVSVQMEEEFLPFVPAGQNPFRRVVSVTLQGAIRDASLVGMTSVDPTGHLKYSAWSEDYVYGSRAVGGGWRGRNSPNLGKYIIEGIVVDANNRPVFGAAIRADHEDVVYSGLDGRFFIRLKKSETVLLSVETKEFMEGAWETLSAPATADAQPDADALSVKIVVRRIS